MDNTIIQSADHLLQIIGIVILAGLIFTKISEFVKLPDVVLYIFAGVLLGPNVLNLVNIDNFPVGNQLILSFGAAYILYDGGREIDLKILNKVKLSVGMLATIGVVISTLIIGFFAERIFTIPIEYALLLGAVIASTDPSVLVPLFKKMNISSKLKQTIIAESAFNDAAGAVITFSILGVIMGGEFSVAESLLELFKAISGGVIVGIAIGYLMHMLTDEKKKGLIKDYAAELVIVSIIGAYLIANHFGFSGFLAVFIVGMFCGNKKKFGFWIPEESFQSHLRFKEVFTIILRMMIFVLLGTHLNFQILIENLSGTLIIVGLLIFIVRPISVLFCVLGDKKAQWTWKQIVYMMWVRETGVIPAALAGMLMTSGVQYAEIISSVTFATIIVTLTFQASTAGLLAKILKLEE